MKPGAGGLELGTGRERCARAFLCVAAATLIGCSRSSSQAMGTDGAIVDVDADTVVVTGAAAGAKAAPDGRPYEYRAVCLEASQHPQPVFVMSRWVEDVKVPLDLGEYHGSWKAKGHHWVVQRRVRPVEQATRENPAGEPHADTAATKAEAH